MGILKWWKRARQQRKAERFPCPGIVAYYWDGGTPKEHAVKNVSLTGAYFYSTERWYPGTIMSLSLKERDEAGQTTSGTPTPTVRCKVVRHGPDGMGITFMLRTKEEEMAIKELIGRASAAAGLAAGQRQSEKGQALIEYALVTPLLFLLIVNCVNFGAFMYDWIEVGNAARTGAQYAILGGASAGSMTAATGSQIAAVITADMASLPGTPTISVCENNSASGTAVISTLTGTCSGTGANAVPADPEPLYYVLATVDVTYPYTPPIGALSFPRLGIYATIPPTSIHRRAVMRLIQ